MRKLHLLWIIPLCILFGALSIYYTFEWFYDMTAWNLVELSATELAKCKNVSIEEYEFDQDELAATRSLLCGDIIYINKTRLVS